MFLDVLGFSHFAFGVSKNSLKQPAFSPAGDESFLSICSKPFPIKVAIGCSGLVEEEKMQEVPRFYHV